MQVQLLAMGEGALLAEVAGLDEVLALHAALQERVQVTDLVPAARTILLRAPGTDLGRLASLVQQVAAETEVGDVVPGTHDEVQIAVTYDGPDLTRVARLTGLSEREVVNAHAGTPWRVAFFGFAPGFGYLTGGDARLSVPRRDEPRTQVPSGSVGLAGGFSAVYPRTSPGGWQLIGRTDAALWDGRRADPAMLSPGGSVRFVAAPESS